MRWTTLALVFAPALIIASCTDLGGLNETTAAPDAASTVATPGADATVPDASLPDAAPRFCESQKGKELCVDFDDGSRSAFTLDTPGAGSINVIDGALFLSSPAGTAAKTGVGKQFSLTNVQSITCELDYKRVTEVSSTVDDVIVLTAAVAAPVFGSSAAIVFEQPAQGVLFAVLTPPDGGTQTQNGVNLERISKPGEWVHLRLEVSVTDKRIQIFRGGLSLGVVSLPYPTPETVEAVSITFGIGSEQPLNAAWTVAFDNIACDL